MPNPNVGLNPAYAATSRSAAASARPSRSAVTTAAVTSPSRGDATTRVATRSTAAARATTIRRTSQAQKSVTARSTTGAASVVARDDTNQLAQTCATQYTQCMDNYCNVLAATQGRCSCSANLKNYAKTEAALKQATEELRDVAQKIQNIGLSADEISALFTQTEAESAMVNTKDTSQLKNDLDRIRGLVIDVSDGRATAAGNTTGGIDMSGLLDISLSDTSDFGLSTLFGTSSAGTSISNQRGEQLYKTATARCKASVLNNCTAAGVDTTAIRNAYDLEIDKACMQYERSLVQQNNQMVSTIRNANTVLQRARLMVGQQKNSYDARGCVAALDQCMRDDIVCGADYEKCLDPTGRYIVNGDVVVGQAIGNATISDADIDTMLRTKIGDIDDRNHPTGLCAAVMLKCQSQTMPDGKYDKNNPVITEYLARARRQIQSARAARISTYAAECIGDISTCLASNNAWGTLTLGDVAINACQAVITTCRSALGYAADASKDTIKQWLQAALGITFAQDTPATNPPASLSDEEKCLSIPNARISKTGTACVVHLDGQDTTDADTKIQNWARAHNGCAWLTQSSESVLNGRQFPGKTVAMYILRTAYQAALTECTQRGGTLNISPDTYLDNSFIYCEIITTQVGAMTAEKCAQYQTEWPYTTGNSTPGEFYVKATENGTPTKWACRYMPRGFYYVGGDLPGECTPGATYDEQSGICACPDDKFDYSISQCTPK
ncbi:hypothetical protein HDR63_01225 [bacterium]|nr:hypothetical protein [bacterium]